MSERKDLYVGLIPDGNRRWAEGKGLSVIRGHEEGTECMKRIFECARDMEIIHILAAWGLSRKNIENRPPTQIAGLYGLLEKTLKDLRDNWMDAPGNQSVRLVHMGEMDRMKRNFLGRQVVTRLNEISEHTCHRAGMIIALCLDYDPKIERRSASRLWKKRGAPDDDLYFLNDLYLPRQGIPFQPVDLVIRTGEDSEQNGGDDDRSHHTNEFLHEYRDETEIQPHSVLFPDYTPVHFRYDIQKLLRMKMKRRKGA